MMYVLIIDILRLEHNGGVSADDIRKCVMRNIFIMTQLMYNKHGFR